MKLSLTKAFKYDEKGTAACYSSYTLRRPRSLKNIYLYLNYYYWVYERQVFHNTHILFQYQIITKVPLDGLKPLNQYI